LSSRATIPPPPNTAVHTTAVVRSRILSVRPRNPRLSRLILFLFLPAIFYFACFAALTYPSISGFSTHFLVDDGDGMVFVWNAWWVKKAVVDLHQSPWHCQYLHFPHGISLAGHTLSPFNAFLAAALVPLLGIVQSINLLVILSFVIGGITAFLLCHEVTKSYGGSLVGGFVFTFSSYHTAHAQAHLNLTSLQWIPLFLLLWLRFLRRPGHGIAACAAIALFLNALCDLYYLIFALLAAAAMTAWYAYRHRRRLRSIIPSFIIPGAVFLAVSAVTTFVLAGWVVLSARGDPFSGPGRIAADFSTDLLSPITPGEYSRYAAFTRPLWSVLKGGGLETSVYLGITVVALSVFAVLTLRRRGGRGIPLWILLLSFFFVLSIGPTAKIWGSGFSAPLIPFLLLFGAWRFRRMLVVEKHGIWFLALAAFAFLFQSPYTRLAPILPGLILITVGGGFLLWRAVSESPSSHFSAGLLAVLTIAIVNADANVHTHAALFGTLALACGFIAYGYARNLLSRKSAAAWAGILGYFLVVGWSCTAPLTSLNLDALPYSLLEFILPPIRMGGTPVRMMVMVTLCAGVLCAFGIRRLSASGPRGRALAVAVFPLIFFDLLPKGLPVTEPSAPRYVSLLASYKNKDAVLNLVDSPGRLMYYQTLYDKPQAFGYTSRIPRRLVKKEHELRNIIQSRQYSRLYPSYRIRYVIAPPGRINASNGFRLLYQDNRAELYDLAVSDLDTRNPKPDHD